MTVTTTPQEIVSAPLELWMAPLGTTFPDVGTAESSFATGWVKIGTNGTNDYDSSGLTVTHNQTLATWTPVGTTAPVKVWRTDEQVEIAVTLADISPTQYALALNDVTPTTVNASTGVVAQTQVTMLQGTTVAVYALLARGISALDNTLNAQYQIPAVYQSANPAPVYHKGAPAELALTFASLLDPNGGGFGYLTQQSA